MMNNAENPKLHLQNVRQRALHWWSELSDVDKIYKCSNYFTKLGYLTRNFDTITGREIQAIYEQHVA